MCFLFFFSPPKTILVSDGENESQEVDQERTVSPMSENIPDAVMLIISEISEPKR